MAMAATIPPGGVFELICSKSENLRPCREDPYRWLQDMSFRHATIAQSAGTAFLGRYFRPTLSCPPFSHREREQRAKEVRDASFDAICRCHLAICDGIFLHPCSERSGPIAFARSLPAAAKYPGPKTRRGSSRHQARGWPQAGLSTADSRGRPRRSGANLE